MADSHTMTETAISAELQLVVFKIGTEDFAFKINNVQEIIRMVYITEIPRAPLEIKEIPLDN